jgi:hypothetical protein
VLELVFPIFCSFEPREDVIVKDESLLADTKCLSTAFLGKGFSFTTLFTLAKELETFLTNEHVAETSDLSIG